MSPDKQVTNSSKSDSTVDLSEQSEEQRRLARRTGIFGVVVLLLGVVAAWFVFTAVQNSRNGNNVTLSAQQKRSYTVKILSMPDGQRPKAESMLDHEVLLSLAQGHELHIRSTGEERVAVCAGHFDAPDSAEARSLLRRVEKYKRGGKPAFRTAEILAYTPEKFN